MGEVHGQKGPAASETRGHVAVARKQIPWDEIRVKYTTDPTLSLRGLAREYRIDYGNLRRRAKRESWGADRERVRKQTTGRALEQATEDLAEMATRGMREALAQARQVRNAYGKRLLRGLDDEATPQTVEETQTATTANAGTSIRRSTRRKALTVDARAYAQLADAERKLFELAFRPGNGPDEGPLITIV